jgi:hypothetical protein
MHVFSSIRGNCQISLAESNAILNKDGVVIAKNRGHLNPEITLTSMPFVIPFNPRIF